MDSELFFINPSTHLDLARKVAFRMNKFQSWDEVEVIGRKVELLGETIEEVHHVGHAKLETYATQYGFAFKLAKPEFTTMAWQWLDLFKEASQRSGCGGIGENHEMARYK